MSGVDTAGGLTGESADRVDPGIEPGVRVEVRVESGRIDRHVRGVESEPAVQAETAVQPEAAVQAEPAQRAAMAGTGEAAGQTGPGVDGLGDRGLRGGDQRLRHRQSGVGRDGQQRGHRRVQATEATGEESTGQAAGCGTGQGCTRQGPAEAALRGQRTVQTGDHTQGRRRTGVQRRAQSGGQGAVQIGSAGQLADQRRSEVAAERGTEHRAERRAEVCADISARTQRGRQGVGHVGGRRQAEPEVGARVECGVECAAQLCDERAVDTQGAAEIGGE